MRLQIGGTICCLLHGVLLHVSLRTVSVFIKWDRQLDGGLFQNLSSLVIWSLLLNTKNFVWFTVSNPNAQLDKYL